MRRSHCLLPVSVALIPAAFVVVSNALHVSVFEVRLHTVVPPNLKVYWCYTLDSFGRFIHLPTLLYRPSLSWTLTLTYHYTLWWSPVQSWHEGAVRSVELQ